jgi:hypothetical protein
MVQPRLNDYRSVFADDVAITLALEKHDHARLRKQHEITRDGAIGLVNLVKHAWNRFCEMRGGLQGLPDPESHEV